MDDEEELIGRILTIAESFELHRIELTWPRTYRVDDLEIVATVVPDMDPQAPICYRIALEVGNLNVVTVLYPLKRSNWRHGGLASLALTILRKHMVLEDLARI